jgi:site-specific DNA-cytosine methylase
MRKTSHRTHHANVTAGTIATFRAHANTGAYASRFNVCSLPPFTDVHNSTREGKNDEANRNIIFSVAPMLEKTKPKTFSSEQTPGFLIIKQHSPWFRMFINTILEAGYNVRWQIQDQAVFEVPQHRPRLIFLGAK